MEPFGEGCRDVVVDTPEVRQDRWCAGGQERARQAGGALEARRGPAACGAGGQDDQPWLMQAQTGDGVDSQLPVVGTLAIRGEEEPGALRRVGDGVPRELDEVVAVDLRHGRELPRPSRGRPWPCARPLV